MAVEVTTLELNARLTNAEQTIAQLQRMGQAGTQVETSFGAMGKQILGFGTAAGVAVIAGQKVISTVTDLGKQAVALAATFEKARMTWGVLVGDMTKGGAVFDKLFQFAAKTPLSFQGVNDAATMLKGFGLATDSLMPALQKLGDLAMGDNGKLQQLAFVYGQTAAQNKALTRDLYQFVNAGVPIFDMLAKTMGKSREEVQKLTETGKVTFGEIEQAVTAATSKGGQFYDMMNTTAHTAMGEWSTAQDNFRLSLARVGDTLLTVVVPALRSYNEAMDNMNSIRNLQTVVASGGGSGDVQAAIDNIKQKIANLEKDPISKEATSFEHFDLIRMRATLDSLLESKRLMAAGRNSVTGIPVPEKPFSIPEGATFGTGSDPLLKNIIAYNSQKYGPEPNGYNFGEPSLPYMTNSYGMQAGPGGPSYMTGGPLTAAILDPNKIDATQAAMENLKKSLAGVATSSMVSTFGSIGKALAEGANGAQSMAQSMQSIASQAASQSGALMMNAGLTAMMAGQLEIGIPLFLAGGGLEILGGYFGSSSSSNSTSAGASAADLAALTAYYQKTEAFNSQGRNRVLGYAAGTNYAMGGWAWVGERGPELMRVPTGAQIIPNHQIRGYADGLNVPAMGTVVNIHNYAGADVSQSESFDANGMRVLDVYLDKKIDAKLARVSAQKVARSGRRVTT